MIKEQKILFDCRGCRPFPAPPETFDQVFGYFPPGISRLPLGIGYFPAGLSHFLMGFGHFLMGFSDCLMGCGYFPPGFV